MNLQTSTQIRYLSANICMISPVGNVKYQDIVAKISILFITAFIIYNKGFKFNESILAHFCIIYNLFGLTTVGWQWRKRFVIFAFIPIFYFCLYAEIYYFQEGMLMWYIISIYSIITVLLPSACYIAGLFMICFFPQKYHEQYKKERIEILLQKIQNYDIVSIQEMTIMFGNNQYEQQLIKGAKQFGLIYVAKSSRWPTFPSILCNSGLLILSRFPIQNHENVHFKIQPWYQWILYHKGIQYCKIQLNNNKHVHLVNLHTSISDKMIQDNLYIFKKDNIHDQNVIGLIQLQQAYDYLVQKLKQNQQNTEQQMIIVSGDFNQQPNSIEYKGISSLLENLCVHDLHYQNGTRQATIGQPGENGEAIEKLMTQKEDRFINQTLDYIFSNIKPVSTGYDSLKNENSKTQDVIQQVSDHWGVTAVFDINHN